LIGSIKLTIAFPGCHKANNEFLAIVARLGNSKNQKPKKPPAMILKGVKSSWW
jgi:hypothetical protein